MWDVRGVLLVIKTVVKAPLYTDSVAVSHIGGTERNSKCLLMFYVQAWTILKILIYSLYLPAYTGNILVFFFFGPDRDG